MAATFPKAMQALKEAPNQVSPLDLAVSTLGHGATLLARPDLGIIAVAWWSAICLLLHGIQLAHALLIRTRAGQPLTSWMRR